METSCFQICQIGQRVLLTKRPSAFGSPTTGFPSLVIESTRTIGESTPSFPLITISSPVFRVVLLMPAASIVAGEDSSANQCTTFPLSSLVEADENMRVLPLY